MAKKRDTATSLAKNRRERQIALREQLSAQGHIQHIVDILEKVQDETQEIDHAMLDRYKLVVGTKLKLVDKYLPTEKPVEVSGDEENPLTMEHKVKFL